MEVDDCRFLFDLAIDLVGFALVLQEQSRP
jgi:hypothetical protein